MCMNAVRTNIEIDPAKLARAKKVTGLKTTRAVVDFALERLEKTPKAVASLLRMGGKVRFRTGYSYKRARG